MKCRKLGNYNTVLSNINSRARFLAASAAGLLLVAACAQAPEQKIAVDSFNVNAAEETLSSGLRIISRRYIDNVPLSSVAEEGLRGMQAIDPALGITRDGPRLRLTHDGDVVGVYPAPPAKDTEAWGKLTARMILAARDASRDMRQASTERIYEAVFDGALSELDIFSRYAGRDEASKNRSRRDGFGGIGIRFKLHDRVPVISRVLLHTPAAKAGLKIGDAITHIDGEPVAASGTRNLKMIARRLRGTEGSEIIVTIKRTGLKQALSFLMTRGHIVPETVVTRVVKGVMVSRIKRFNRSTAADLARDLQFNRNALGDSLKGIVLDLRGNPGGLLKQSVKVADLFLTQGDILSTKGRHPSSFQSYEAGGRDLADGLPLVVLVDGKTASAAEIVASALQDRGRAVVVGTASYGKGSVQTVQHLPNDGELTLTWSRFITPSGYTLHGLGVYPSICTSGVYAVETIMNRAIARSTDVALTMASWRRTAYNATSARHRLRASCAAESRYARKKTGDVDLNVAFRLMDKPRQYAHARLLAIEPAASTAELAR